MCHTLMSRNNLQALTKNYIFLLCYRLTIKLKSLRVKVSTSEISHAKPIEQQLPTYFCLGNGFFLVAMIGFAYVKWIPYYAKAFLAYSQHAIGDSIISGKASSVPPASWSAALDYAIAYGQSIWKAMVLGLILGSGIQVLLPSRWVSAVLGRLGFRSVMLGGLLPFPA